jgi:putative tryptophan/tyrosine transport system substrate-binding protein
MDRRAFLAGATTLLAAPLAAEAPPGAKKPSIGFLGNSSPAGDADWLEAFQQGLHDAGYVEGQNIAIEYRWAQGKPERFPDLAAEMVRLKVDVIVTGVDRSTQAAQAATRSIPIVMAIASDPVALGFVASLARPGGNITGLSLQFQDLPGIRLQLLREAVPKAKRVAILWDPTEPGRRDTVRQAAVAARGLGLELQALEVRSPAELDSAFTNMTRGAAAAVLVLESARFGAQRRRIAELTLTSRLPAMCVQRRYAEDGCLMSYGASFTDLYRRAASFVDKILKGAKPADLPVEQPTTFELIINLKTARALGLTIPPSLLARADQVIE